MRLLAFNIWLLVVFVHQQICCTRSLIFVLWDGKSSQTSKLRWSETLSCHWLTTKVKLLLNWNLSVKRVLNCNCTSVVDENAGFWVERKNNCPARKEGWAFWASPHTSSSYRLDRGLSPQKLRDSNNMVTMSLCPGIGKVGLGKNGSRDCPPVITLIANVLAMRPISWVAIMMPILWRYWHPLWVDNVIIQLDEGVGHLS